MFRRTRPPAVEPPEGSKQRSGPPEFPPNRIVSEGGSQVWVAVVVALVIAGGAASAYFLTGDKSTTTTAQAAESKPTTVTRTGKVIRKETAVYNNIHYFYLALEVNNNGASEVITLYATGERLEVPMMVVGDTVSFTTKIGAEEVINLRIDWSKRPELAK